MIATAAAYYATLLHLYVSQQGGIDFKRNLNVRIGQYGSISKLRNFWVLRNQKSKNHAKNSHF